MKVALIIIVVVGVIFGVLWLILDAWVCLHKFFDREDDE